MVALRPSTIIHVIDTTILKQATSQIIVLSVLSDIPEKRGSPIQPVSG